MLGKHILVLFDTNEAVILPSINHILQSLEIWSEGYANLFIYLFIFGGVGGGEEGGQGVRWEMCKLQMLMFITFCHIFWSNKVHLWQRC